MNEYKKDGTEALVLPNMGKDAFGRFPTNHVYSDTSDELMLYPWGWVWDWDFKAFVWDPDNQAHQDSKPKLLHPRKELERQDKVARVQKATMANAVAAECRAIQEETKFKQEEAVKEEGGR